MRTLNSLVIIFSLLSVSMLSAQTISKEKIFHFSLNGPEDTLDLVQVIKLKYGGSPYAFGVASADTNRFGEDNSAVRLTGTYFEIPNNNQFNLDEDSAVTISFWLKSNREYDFYELLDFFKWKPLSITHYNHSVIVSGGWGFGFVPPYPMLLHFVFTFDKGICRLYLNNELMYAEKRDDLVTTINEKITMGTNHSDYTLDELIMYKGVLSDDEVSILYNDKDLVLSTASGKMENTLRLSLVNNELLFSDMVENLEVRQMNGVLIVKSNNVQQVSMHTANELLIVKYQYRGLTYIRKIVGYSIDY